MICFGTVPIGSVLPVWFGSYGKTDGDSVTLSGLATSDIEIYKGVSLTQRSSDAGYTLLDTDGIDIESMTGINAFSIDTGDDTDAGFYAAGSFYTVIVSSVTIDTEVVNFVAATFRLGPAESSAGVPKVDVSHAAGTAWNSGGITSNTFASGAITATAIATDAIGAAELADGAITAATFAAGAIDATAIANGAIDAATFAAGAIDAAAIANGAIDANTFAAGAIDAAAIADNAIDAGAIAANAITAAKIADGALDAATFTACIVTGTCDAGSTTTSIVASAVSPASAVNDQFNGRIIIFDRATSTAALRGQASDITDYVHATLTLTVTALTTAPSAGDTFHIL